MAIAQPISSHDEGADLVGTYRRFGKLGPVYEVLEVEANGSLLICLVESGRTERYPVDQAYADPLA